VEVIFLKGRPIPVVRLTFTGLQLAAAVAAGMAVVPLLAVFFVASEGAGVDWSGVADFGLTSVFLGLFVGLTIAPVGALAAWLVVRYRFPGRQFFSWALALPLALPVFALAQAYIDLLDVAGPVAGWVRRHTGTVSPPEIRSFPGAVFIMSCAFYPYVFLAMKAAFRQHSGAMVEAAQSLGAGPGRNLAFIAWPMAWPALAAGVALGVMETLADYGAVSLLSVQTLTTAVVRSWSVDGSVTSAAQFSLPLLALAVGLMWLERMMRGGRKFTAAGSWRPMQIVELKSFEGAVASLFCTCLLAFSLVIPVFWLITKALGVEPDLSRLLRAAGHSVFLGGLGSLTTVALAACLVLGGSGRPFLLRLASLGYAAPGAVIAIGLLAPVSVIWRLGQGEVQFALGLILLLYAYTSRLMAAAVEPIEAGLARVGPGVVRVSASLGRNDVETAWLVQVPLARNAFLAAGLIVFVDVMKELPATLMLRPFNFDTLAVISSHYALDERLGQAAWPALLILAFSLPAVVWLSSEPMMRSSAERERR
jgi:iron(III) transport system permease protein